MQPILQLTTRPLLRVTRTFHQQGIGGLGGLFQISVSVQSQQRTGDRHTFKSKHTYVCTPKHKHTHANTHARTQRERQIREGEKKMKDSHKHSKIIEKQKCGRPANYEYKSTPSASALRLQWNGLGQGKLSSCVFFPAIVQFYSQNPDPVYTTSVLSDL